MTATATRKVIRPGEADEPRVEKAGDTWHIRSMDATRQILRARDATTQAGFTCERVPEGRLVNPPILFLDGERHRTQRAKVARFFAPKTVSTRYRGLMESRADDLVAEMLARGTFKLDEVSFRYSVEVASQVIGLTNSPVIPMARRLNRFFANPTLDELDAMSKPRALWHGVFGQWPMGTFYLRDVRPAIQARRKQPEDDVISHLIAEGYKDPAILIECITFGAAGMVTTREFISMATWHLLENPELRGSFLAADEGERHGILHEILRVEPIVGHLYRRARTDLEITDAGETYAIKAGDLCDLYIRQANADATVVGENPTSICPGRDLPRGVGDEVESFGDGAHKCPGNAVAIYETDALLTRLLKHQLTIIRRPRIGWDELIAGYSLRGFVLRIA